MHEYRDKCDGVVCNKYFCDGLDLEVDLTDARVAMITTISSVIALCSLALLLAFRCHEKKEDESDQKGTETEHERLETGLSSGSR